MGAKTHLSGVDNEADHDEKICTYAHDINGQPSALREDLIPSPAAG
ncbi:hypothetical protein RA272_24280 [Pseudomonas syringae pv. tagetis]|uniref:Trypsin-like serine protease/Peptidase S1 n=2 Tax=Pseudomonas syringae group genomosp. 7 TaxID=251699 RepID=A0A0Q0CI32_9PSED|nr:hypothetical protein [Pseudomonas syringae group genomosp. 7]KPX39443.1 Trypsin-like serine protease/Peptidase S1 [Pseudomonas syringae pv. helianthi]KPY84782.1 Trypsin-like serine protease/Peptidase S1 [Pseudomonas syringae pv. tagetis]RMR08800.1 Trypsin-like serine protease/Peptidase S1 [Pseudomonas syringae pv. helianthi]RMV49841.1 Trypsin-like serine protease/Peptidase S1 [Pseudomonas syringae pv. helianthi]RMW16945.1 Trypsin-like serine protease/Peptidase S1 [Pseudomonas syringae pv. t